MDESPFFIAHVPDVGDQRLARVIRFWRLLRNRA
jgi:hypothetical protein